MVHKWADWLRRPCRVGGRKPLRAGDKIRSGPPVGHLAVSPLLSMGSPTPQSGGQNQQWPTCGGISYVIPAVWGLPRLRVGDKIRYGPPMGGLATYPLLFGGSPKPQSGGQNQEWPTSGVNRHITQPTGGPQRFRVRDKMNSGP